MNENQLSYDKQNVTYPESFSHRMRVPDGTTDLVVPIGSVTTAKTFAFKSNQAVSFKFNGSLVSLPAEGGLWHATVITALTISNASGSEAEVQMLVAGE